MFGRGCFWHLMCMRISLVDTDAFNIISQSILLAYLYRASQYLKKRLQVFHNDLQLFDGVLQCYYKPNNDLRSACWLSLIPWAVGPPFIGKILQWQCIFPRGYNRCGIQNLSSIKGQTQIQQEMPKEKSGVEVQFGIRCLLLTMLQYWPVCVHECMCVCARVCVCVCARARVCACVFVRLTPEMMLCLGWSCLQF